jgi:hypothetical protein
MSGVLVKIEESNGFIYENEFTSISNTRQSVLIPSGLESIEISFFPTAAASVYDVLDVVINASNDGDANTKLSTVGTRYPIPAGKTLRQTIPSGGTLITRIDLKTRAAAAGANLVVIYGKMPV